jgi:hypothetical protein
VAVPPRKKSNAIWWILGGLIAVLVVGVGLVVLIIALANFGTNNRNLNANRNENRNANVSVNTNVTNTNLNANATVPTSLTDDFSEQKWWTGTSSYGRIWYDNGEYHMASKQDTYIVIYAPSDDYSSENATVKVSARSVDGSVPSAGFGLLVHCGYSKTKKLDDYALLIFPGPEPEYEIVLHKDGYQTPLVTRTQSSAIKSGTSPNELEVRIRGAEMAFYANGQLLTRLTDTANYRRGKVGFYTSDVTEVAFDNLEIDH